MAKTHAERQKEYRERKKAASGSKWLEKESRRTQKYYVKVDNLTCEEVKKQRKRVRENLRKRRATLKTSKMINETSQSQRQPESGESGVRTARRESGVRKRRLYQQEDNQPEPGTSGVQTTSERNEEPTTSGTIEIQYGEVSSTKVQVQPDDTRLIVKLPVSKSKPTSKLRRKLKYLEKVKAELKKKNNSLRKQVRRIRVSRSSKTKTDKNNNANTPSSQTKLEMKQSGVDPEKHPQIRKKLMFANCIATEMRRNKIGSQSYKKSLIKRVVACEVLRKYKLSQYASSLIGVSGRKPKSVRKDSISKKRKLVREFLAREDNSRQLPGKRDCVKNESKERIQKYVLNDYLRNIFMKFKAENSDVKISFATFCRARPRHMTTVNYAARITCLCTRHQNFALKLKCLKAYGVTNNTSPDNFAENTTPEELKEKVTLTITGDDDVAFKEWRRVTCEDGKQRTKLLEVKQDIQKFAKEVSKELQDFIGHADRVKQQFNSFKSMKDSLKCYSDHVCVQMDFSENYSLKQLEEIQCAYWNPEAVTLHPVVVYYNGNGEVKHRSLVIVSDVLKHNAQMVMAILNKVIEWVKEVHPITRFIHYWTDSPTSQYRNKSMFDIVARHEILYGIRASWQYFEAGHGKGACDGIGGVVKRSADTAMKTGNFSITSGKEFFEWASKTDSKIKYEFVDKKEYDDANQNYETRLKEISPVEGTMMVHSVAQVNSNEVMVRNTTCVCSECFTNGGFVWSENNTCGWKKGNLIGKKKTKKHQNEQETQSRPSQVSAPKTTREDSSVIEPEIGEFIAANYDGKVYIGKVVDIDEGSYEVTFMEWGSKIKECLKWPKPKDQIWIDSSDIHFNVKEPLPHGKGKRSFKLNNEDNARVKAQK